MQKKLEMEALLRKRPEDLRDEELEMMVVSFSDIVASGVPRRSLFLFEQEFRKRNREREEERKG